MSQYKKISTRRWMAFWGCMDLLRFAVCAFQYMQRGRSPFSGAFIDSMDVSSRYEGWLPMAISAMGLSFYLSLLFSGVLLILGARAGLVLAFVQSPVRVILLLPSVFPLDLIAGLKISVALFLVILIFGEICKVITLRSRVAPAIT